MNIRIVFLSSLSMTSAFTIPTTTKTYATKITSKSALATFEQSRHNRGNKSPLGMTANAQGGGTKKRRKRKEGKEVTAANKNDGTSEATTTTAAANDAAENIVPISPRPNTVVLPVRDIRDVLSGSDSAPSSSAVLQEDEEWEYYDDDDDDEEDSKASIPDRNTKRRLDDSMEQLLADARRMRADGGVQSAKETDKAMSDTFFEVISTIVTIDFFVVIALLVWFLAGIFCSSVLKNDAVQIAFNMNFERVTQPALGILMIGSVAGGEFDASSHILLTSFSCADEIFFT